MRMVAGSSVWVLALVVLGFLPVNALAVPCDLPSMFGPSQSNPGAANSRSAYFSLADFNGDGRLDVAVCDNFFGYMRPYLNLPAPDSSSGIVLIPSLAYIFTPESRMCASGDFNSDGIPDLAVAEAGYNRVSILFGVRGPAGFSFAQGAVYASTLAYWVVVRDLNADGIQDLVISRNPAVEVLLGNGTGGKGDGTFRPGDYDRPPLSVPSLEVCDLNGDSVPDIVGMQLNGDRLWVLMGEDSLGRPTGTFAPAQRLDFPANYMSLRIRGSDLDGDGRQDLVIATEQGIRVLFNQTAVGAASASFTFADFSAQLSIRSVNDVLVFDFNHDMVPDVGLACGSLREMRVALGVRGGGTWTPGPFVAFPGKWASNIGLEQADFDGDGVPDLVTSSSYGPGLEVRRGLCAAVPEGHVQVTSIAHGPGVLSLSPGRPAISRGTVVQAGAHPLPGARFLGWSGAIAGTDSTVSFVAQRSATVHGYFATTSRVLDVATVGGGAVVRSLDLPAYPDSAYVTLWARPAYGWRFVRWEGSAPSSDSVITVLLATDRHVTARFEFIPVSLNRSAEPLRGGTVGSEPDLQVYPLGSSVTLTGLASYGFHFDHWEGLPDSDTSSVNPVTITLHGSRSVVAHFTGDPMPVVIDVIGHGRVVRTPDTPTVPFGSVLAIEAIPDRGHVLASWGGDLWGNWRQVMFEVFGPVYAVANFEENFDYAPTVLSLTDRPGDEGGWLSVRWQRAFWDVPDSSGGSYLVWRSIDPASALASLAAGAAVWANGAPAVPASTRTVRAMPRNGAVYWWEHVSTIAAAGEHDYTCAVPTGADSVSANDPPTLVFVQGRSTADDYWWNSAIDSARSVDNLPPLPPLTASLRQETGGISVQWAPSSSPDVAGYRLYRGANAGFIPDVGTLVGSTREVSLLLPGQLDTLTFVRIAAVDVHGNEGASLLVRPEGLGVPASALHFSLDPPRPNPSHGDFTTQFELISSEPARLELIDVSGRLVQLQDMPWPAPGVGRAVWRLPAALPAGLYFVRLSQGGRTVTRRLTLVP
ncbi:MAG: T9SS type A sorting domain-containing protein [Candidatus Eisenbacteria bacterium]|nr:T9SS type A sorting domain-containing protein [Candidatus Eisenbacteria bacterium]